MAISQMTNYQNSFKTFFNRPFLRQFLSDFEKFNAVMIGEARSLM